MTLETMATLTVSSLKIYSIKTFNDYASKIFCTQPLVLDHSQILTSPLAI